MNGFTKTLKIEVETEYEDDEDHEGVRGKLKVELRGKDVQKLEGAIVEGPQSWTGLLCDGTTALVDYTVSADGTVSEPIVTLEGSATSETDMDDDGFKVTFEDSNGDDGAYVKVEVDKEDGQLELKVKSKTTAACDEDDEDHNDDDDKKHDDDDDDKKHDEDDDDKKHDEDDDDDQDDAGDERAQDAEHRHELQHLRDDVQHEHHAEAYGDLHRARAAQHQ